ncbi:hypothetical protein [Caldivirga maquilingensis]|uniref:Uncharacterized protein n=1 Tax=Caldivirga maquilingensis (strain ATCC 700844 / DSM 13496 / JCM 10307 / IC-167) TaxID=397948 RepID=A8MCK5_CALMQ|nr:hypothetical protein [Caldivirga maquilingensis]ABW01511.1 hypothetical protein Cmaq_0671 [Caldivirga maquilingensis IC-167]
MNLIPSVMLLSTVAAVIAVLLAGPLALIINYKWLIVVTLIASLAYAPIALILHPNLVNLIILAFTENFAMGLVPYLLINRFNVQYRASGLGISYNWGLLIGGWAPMVVVMSLGVVLAILSLTALTQG